MPLGSEEKLAQHSGFSHTFLAATTTGMCNAFDDGPERTWRLIDIRDLSDLSKAVAWRQVHHSLTLVVLDGL